MTTKKSAVVTTKNFSSKLSRAINSRDSIQELCDFGVEYLITSQDRNCLYLSKLRDAVKKNHGFNVRKLESYIKARVNVTTGKDKNGEFIFRAPKAQDGKSVPLKTTKIATPWYNYAPKTAKRDNVVRLSTLQERIAKISDATLDKADMHAQAGAALIAAYMQTDEFKNAVKKSVCDRKDAAAK